MATKGKQALTRTQQNLKSEVEEIASFVQMDVWNIEQYEARSRTTRLQMMRDRLVRAYIISHYTLMDELLTDVICNYYFRRPKNNTYGSLWRTKRFRVFVHHITDEMFLGKKLSVVDAIKSVPIDVSKAIRRVNDVRNDIAHTFFPENRRRYMADKHVTYRGSPLFSIEGLEKFREDCFAAEAWLHKAAFGGTWRV